MAIRYWHDLYPADDPRDGTRVVRFTHHQKAHYEHVRNGAGSGLVELRGTTSDAQLIAPSGMQYVRVVEENTVAATETVRGGYWLEEGDFLALDRKRLKKLRFGGTGTLSYLDREVMWSHSYAYGIVSGFVPQDPFDGIWRLWNQGDAMGGDKLGAILWRVIKEGQAYRSGATYTHRHAIGDEFNVEFTDAHDDDKLETAIPFVTLGFDQFEDSSGNAWSVISGEFEAQVGESLFEVTKRLMDAGLYVELDPDTFELRAWEVANHGRDRTGLAWGADVVRFEPPPPPSTDRAEGNILNDLKRALKPFIKVTAVLAGGGADTYAVATASGVVPWHRFRPLDINDTTALSTAATRDITRRNDAGATVLVRSKVGNDPANGYYLPEEHAKLDDLVTVHSGTDTWDWDEAAYPIAKWSVTSRRTGAPDVFYHLGASYHAGASKEFAGGAGVGRHTHPPNPRLCVPGSFGTSSAFRRYFTLNASGISSSPAYDAGWESGPATPYHKLASSPEDTRDGGIDRVTADDTRLDTFAVQMDAALASVIAAGGATVKMYARARARAGVGIDEADQDLISQIVVRVTQGDSTTIRGTALPLHNLGSSAGSNKWRASSIYENRLFPPAAAPNVLSAVPGSQAGDFLLVEVGYRHFAPAPPEPTGGGLWFRDSSAEGDLPEDETSTANLNPWIEIATGGVALTTVNDGHPALIGSGGQAKRCSDTEHFFATRKPTADDNFANFGMRYGTHWVHVDDVKNPTESFGSWMLADATAGTWIRISEGTAHQHALADLEDVDTATVPPADADSLVWDDANSRWVPGSPAASTVSIADAGGHFTGTDVEAALQELGAVGTPAATGGLPLTAVVNGEPVLLWDENNSLIGAA